MILTPLFLKKKRLQFFLLLLLLCTLLTICFPQNEAQDRITYHLLIFSHYTTLAGMVIIISTRLDTNLWHFSCLNLLSSEITAVS